MPDYWLDSSVFISAKDGPYGFDRVPGFWRFLDQQAKLGVLGSSMMVYEELMKGRDYLKDWIKNRKSTLFVPADSNDVQTKFTDIADYVTDAFPESEASIFLSGADAWIIAHAVAQGGSVVSVEALAGPGSKRVKIPNVSQHFGIRTIHYYEMAAELNATFT